MGMEWAWAALLLATCLHAAKFPDLYDEELSISRIPSGNIAANFRFVVSNVHKLSNDAYFFPPIMTELIEKYSLSELRLSLGRGNWQSSQWGPAPQPASPQGARISAWIDDATNDTVVASRWAGLVSSMNGLFCTSLSSLHPSHSDSPSMAPPPAGPSYKNGPRALRTGVMAEETVCTENLTPLRKLLPCKEAGLVSLLNPLRLFDSAFHSLAFHLHLQCPDGTTACSSPTWSFSLEVSVVFDLPIKTRSLNWSFSSLFGRHLVGACPVSRSSSLVVHDSLYSPTLSVAPPTSMEKKKRGGAEFTVVNLKSSSSELEVSAAYSERNLPLERRAPLPVVSISSSLLGGEASLSGIIRYSVTNGGEKEHKVLLSASIPWYAELEWSTLALDCATEKGTKGSPVSISRAVVPAIARSRPALIEWTFLFPPHALCHVSIHFTRAFMRMSEYPADAHHGKYIPPASITILQGVNTQQPPSILGDVHTTAKEAASSPSWSPSMVSSFSPPLLLTLPVPDFSMPFNVEAFVCVVLCLSFQPLINFTVYTMVPCPHEPRPPLLKRFLRAILYVLTGLAAYAEYNQVSPSQLMRYGRAGLRHAATVINATFSDLVLSTPLGIAGPDNEEL